MGLSIAEYVVYAAEGSEELRKASEISWMNLLKYPQATCSPKSPARPVSPFLNKTRHHQISDAHSHHHLAHRPKALPRHSEKTGDIYTHDLRHFLRSTLDEFFAQSWTGIKADSTGPYSPFQHPLFRSSIHSPASGSKHPLPMLSYSSLNKCVFSRAFAADCQLLSCLEQQSFE